MIKQKGGLNMFEFYLIFSGAFLREKKRRSSGGGSSEGFGWRQLGDLLPQTVPSAMRIMRFEWEASPSGKCTEPA